MIQVFLRLFKEPLIQFLLIGACIYGAYGLFGAPQEADYDTTILVDANRVNGFVAQWAARWNRPPTRKELDGVIDQYVREEVLYRQAVAMGLNENDPVTRRRMAQKLEFLTSDLARATEPTEAELAVYFQDNIKDFRKPDQVSFIQVFFDPDARDDATLADAGQALAQLRAAGVPEPGTLEAGDRSMVPSYFELASALEIQKRLGRGFSEQLMTLEPGSWHGPVLSGFGVHLVYVYEHREASSPVLSDAIRPQVLDRWQAAQMETFNENFYEALRSRYQIIINDDQLAPGSVLQVGERTGGDSSGQDSE